MLSLIIKYFQTRFNISKEVQVSPHVPEIPQVPEPQEALYTSQVGLQPQVAGLPVVAGLPQVVNLPNVPQDLEFPTLFAEVDQVEFEEYKTVNKSASLRGYLSNVGTRRVLTNQQNVSSNFVGIEKGWFVKMRLE